MDNFRKRNRGEQRQAIDSILNAPSRSQDAGSSFARRPLRLDGLRSASGRRVDDFARPDGYHVAQSSSVRTDMPEQAPTAKTHDPATSLLHMTLPADGSLASAVKQQGRKRSKDKAKRGRLRSIRKWALRSTLILVGLVLLIGGALAAKGALKLHKVFKGGGAAAALEQVVKPELLKGEGDGRVNILLLGKGGPGQTGPDLTDTIIVASVDPVNKTATLVSVPRDLWVTVSGYGTMKINAVYANAKYRSLNSAPKDTDKAEKAGTAAIENQISQVLGIHIHYYGMIDFAGFKQAVDIVGGVDINVPEELTVSEHMWDSTTNRPYFLNVPAGIQHFDSTRALYFTRSRHTSNRGDFDRAERQRLFIQALVQKVLSAGTYTNPLKISQLIDAFGNHISLDLSTNDALRLMQIGKGIDLSKLKSIGLADPPNALVRTDNVDGQSVVRPVAGFGDYGDIQNMIRNTLKDPYLAKENATIAIFNGTNTAGLASAKADLLKSYGYNVTVVADAPTHDYTQTVLVDLSGSKPFTKNYLENRFGITAVGKLPDTTIQTQGANFVLILGQDAQ